MSKLGNMVPRKIRGGVGNAVMSTGTVAALLVGGLIAAWVAVWMVHYMAEFGRWLPVLSELL